eukprot:6921453-Prymnesium_polylepis.1
MASCGLSELRRLRYIQCASARSVVHKHEHGACHVSAHPIIAVEPRLGDLRAQKVQHCRRVCCTPRGAHHAQD